MSAWIDRYLSALEYELEVTAATTTIQPKTLYMGGGTPSILPPPQLDKLLTLIHKHMNLDALSEWTLEGNPGTFTEDKIAILQTYGVNRISLGAQSMDDSILVAIGRRHTALQTQQTVQTLQSAGFENIGLDLIACLPGVDPIGWQRTLDKTLELAPTHISVYALTAEPGSKLFQQVQRQENLLATDEDEQIALSTAEATLATSGYPRYEISNYAQAGNRCRHNVAVWLGDDYVGFGPAASSRVGNQRRTNDADLAAYCEAVAKNAPPPHISETLSPETDATERFIFTFRIFEGIDPHAFAQKHGPTALRLLPYWMEKLSSMRNEGLVSQTDRNWALTPKGRPLADAVAECLLP